MEGWEDPTIQQSPRLEGPVALLRLSLGVNHLRWTISTDHGVHMQYDELVDRYCHLNRDTRGGRIQLARSRAERRLFQRAQ
jgi:hypothetical protein